MVNQISNGPLEGPHNKAVWNTNRSGSQGHFLEGVGAGQIRDLSHVQSESHLHIDIALKDQCGIEDFAIVFLKPDGRPATHTSTSLQGFKDSMFSPNIDSLFERVSSTLPRHATYATEHVREDNVSGFSNDVLSYNRRQSACSTSDDYRTGPRQLQHRDTVIENGPPASARKRHRGLQLTPRYAQNVGPAIQATSKPLKLKDRTEVSKFLEMRFKNMHQQACRLCAKGFIKKIEPKKQTNFPYTGGDLKAPKWWPLATKHSKGARHKEPDHIIKNERILLLVHIVMLIASPPEGKPETMRGIDIKELDVHTTEYMQAWFSDRDNPDNAKKLPYLREIFKVARNYERFLNGELDDTAVVMVSHGDGISEIDDEIEEGHQYDEDGELNAEYTPPSSMASPRESIVSESTLRPPHSQASFLHETRNDNSPYHLPVRSYQQQQPAQTEDAHFQDSSTPFRTSQPSSMYSSSTPAMFSPDAMRRQASWTNPTSLNVTVPGTNHFSSTTGSPFSGHWPASNTNQMIPYGNSYTTSQPQTPQGVLPPPTGMLQQHGSASYNHHIYMPPPPQENMRTCVLPGPPQSILSGAHQNFGHTGHSQYANYLEEKIEDQYNAGQDISHR